MNLEQIKEIQERLRTQDNYSTSWPLYCVMETKEIWGMEEDFDDNGARWAYIDDGEVKDTKIIAALNSLWSEVADDDYSVEVIDDGGDERSVSLEQFRRFYFVTKDFVVQTFFTEIAAKDYIEKNSHRHSGKLSMYVDSAYRNTEMQNLIDFVRTVDLEKLK